VPRFVRAERVGEDLLIVGPLSPHPLRPMKAWHGDLSFVVFLLRSPRPIAGNARSSRAALIANDLRADVDITTARYKSC
jgi:hypothetical protein